MISNNLCDESGIVLSGCAGHCLGMQRLALAIALAIRHRSRSRVIWSSCIDVTRRFRVHTITGANTSRQPTAPALGKSQHRRTAMTNHSFKASIGTPLILASLLATAGAIGCGSTSTASSHDATTPTSESQAGETTMTPRDIVLKTVNALFTDFDVDTAKEHLAADYIQHNPGVPTGAAPILGFIPALKESGIRSTVHRVIADDDFVVLHVTYENAKLFGADTLVAFDVFRVQDGKVAEHWDNLQQPPAQTASGRSMTDGQTQVGDLDRTAENKRVVEAFATDVLLGGKFDRAPQYIASEPGAYLQHNPMVADGLDKLGEAFAYLASNGQAISYAKIHKVVGQGNFVFVMSEGKLGDAPTAYFDLFRLEDGKIVEHWDTIAAIPPAAEMAHDNGKF
jgi:predicted SnoaL-like aldol condensation-catalyzing enzyme